MKDYSAVFAEVAARPPHAMIFEGQSVGGELVYPHNTHEMCAELLWAFCEEMATRAPGERFGLLTKDPGENGYTWPSGHRTSHDTVAKPNGERVDTIGSAGDPQEPPRVNAPWAPTPPSEWRPTNVWIAHTDVATSGSDTPPQPGDLIPVIPFNDAYAVEFGLACNDVFAETGTTDNGMMAVQSARAAWDYYVGGMPWPASCEKHTNELRAEYGLPPLPTAEPK